MELKTMKQWEASRRPLSEFLQVGDPVDDEIVDYFIGVLPPETQTRECIQIGEPYSHNAGGETFITLEKIDNVWTYAGIKNKHMPTKTHSEEWFNDAFKNTPAPLPIRRLSERICRSYNIGGICDPAYIANIIALELGFGDGQSHFTEFEAVVKKARENEPTEATCTTAL